MAGAKIAISIDLQLLEKLDRLIQRWGYASRSQAIQIAVREKIDRAETGRLARECARLSPHEERGFAEEAFGEGDEWPEY